MKAKEPDWENAPKSMAMKIAMEKAIEKITNKYPSQMDSYLHLCGVKRGALVFTNHVDGEVRIIKTKAKRVKNES